MTSTIDWPEADHYFNGIPAYNREKVEAIVAAEVAKREAEITKLRKVIDYVVIEASESISYIDDTDSIGFHPCCDAASCEPHADDCYMKAAIDAAKEWT